MPCPKECSEDRDRLRESIKTLFTCSLPTWARAWLITALVALFALYGSLWVYAGATYATKTAVRDLRNDMREMQAEQGSKLDRILEALMKRSP